MRDQRSGSSSATKPPCETAPLLSSHFGDDSNNGDAPKMVTTATSPPAHCSGGDDADTVRGEGNPELLKQMPTIIAAVGIGVYMGSMEQLLAATICPKIGSELNALNSTSWIATAYFLTLTSFQPLYGKLSDVFGRKECLLFSYFMFGVGCLGCGLAQNMVQLCMARAVAGVGGAGMAPVTSILISDIVPLRDRGLWQGYINIIFGLGSATGAPLGGWLADSVGWRWAFIGQTPICAAAFIAVSLCIPSTVQPTAHPLLAKLGRVDFLGALTLIVAVVSLVVSLDSGANRGWSDTWTTASLAVSLPSFGLFALVETRIASDPFAPARVVLHPPVFATNIVAALVQGAQMSALFLFPLFYQAVLGYSSSFSGTLLVPCILSMIVGGVGSGVVMRRTGRFRNLIALALAGHTLSLAPVALSTAYENVLGTVIGNSVASLAVAVVMTSIVVALLALMPDAGDTATVVACQYLFRSLGNSVGVSLSAAVLQGTLRLRLASRLGGGGTGVDEAKRIEERVRMSLDHIKELPPDLARLVRLSYRDSTLAAMVPIALFVVGAAIASLFIKNRMIRR